MKKVATILMVAMLLICVSVSLASADRGDHRGHGRDIVIVTMWVFDPGSGTIFMGNVAAVRTPGGLALIDCYVIWVRGYGQVAVPNWYHGPLPGGRGGDRPHHHDRD